MGASEISFRQAVSGSDKDEWHDAIYKEMKSIISNDTFDVVTKPKDAKTIGCRTVLRNKYCADGTLDRRKARLVAKGFTQLAAQQLVHNAAKEVITSKNQNLTTKKPIPTTYKF